MLYEMYVPLKYERLGNPLGNKPERPVETNDQDKPTNVSLI